MELWDAVGEARLKLADTEGVELHTLCRTVENPPCNVGLDAEGKRLNMTSASGERSARA